MFWWQTQSGITLETNSFPDFQKQFYSSQKLDPARFYVNLQWLKQTHIQLSQAFKRELFAKIINDFQSLIIFVKSFILDAWLGSEYTSVK